MYYLVTDQDQLIEAFAGQTSDVYASIEQLPVTHAGDVIVLSAPFVPLQTFGSLRVHQGAATIYYVCDKAPSQMESMLASTHGVQLIPPGDPSLVPVIVESAMADQQPYQRKVIAFAGALPNIGLTHTVLSIAQFLSSTLENIGVLGLNLYDEGPLSDAVSYLNDLKPYLAEAEFAAPTLQRYVTSRQFSYLPGNREYLQIYYYTPDEAKALLDVAAQTFSLTFVDCGAYLDTATACEALQAADLVFLLTQDTPKSLDRLEKSYSQVMQHLGLDTDRMATIVLGANSRTLTKFRNIPSIAEIPHLHYRDVQLAEASGQLLTSLNDPAYQQGIQSVAKVIAAHYNLPLSTVAATKTRASLFGRRS